MGLRPCVYIYIALGVRRQMIKDHHSLKDFNLVADWAFAVCKERELSSWWWWSPSLIRLWEYTSPHGKYNLGLRI